MKINIVTPIEGWSHMYMLQQLFNDLAERNDDQYSEVLYSSNSHGKLIFLSPFPVTEIMYMRHVFNYLFIVF